MQYNLGEHGFEVFAGVAGFYFYDFFGRALGDDGAAFVAAFGAEIDDPVCAFDDIEIVFDDDECVAVVGEAIYNRAKAMDIFKVEAGRWFIEDVEC